MMPTASKSPRTASCWPVTVTALPAWPPWRWERTSPGRAISTPAPYAEEDGVLTDPGEPADDVVTAVNGFHLLARDGVKNESMLSNANEGINSRTVIGITETGIVHIFAINKPSANISTDLTTGSNFREICEYMMDELGCVDVLNMDGGGSTEMLAAGPAATPGWRRSAIPATAAPAP